MKKLDVGRDRVLVRVDEASLVTVAVAVAVGVGVGRVRIRESSDGRDA